MQLLQQRIVRSGQQLVKYVEVPFPITLVHHPALLQQVVQDVAPLWGTPEIELHVHVLAEARRIVVPVRFGIAERLQHRIALQQFVLDAFHAGRVPRRRGNELQDLLRRFRLTRAALARDQDTLAPVFLGQRSVRVVAQGKAVSVEEKSKERKLRVIFRISALRMKSDENK